MYALWTAFKKILIESYESAFLTAPSHIVGKKIDAVTNKAIFTIKFKRMPTPISLTTSEIILDDKYFSGLSERDRVSIEKQYILEISTTLAYIMEHPLGIDESRAHFFKIFSVEENKIICGNASYFMSNRRDLVFKLSKKDIVSIVVAYTNEQYQFRLKNESRLESVNTIKLIP